MLDDTKGCIAAIDIEPSIYWMVCVEPVFATCMRFAFAFRDSHRNNKRLHNTRK